MIDHARAWLALKAVIVAKRSHGARDLLAEMARIEVESQIDTPDFPLTSRTPASSQPESAGSNGGSSPTH